MRSVGNKIPAIDGTKKVTAESLYLDDLRLPGMLWGKIVRSPHPHARVRCIDADRARALPGVRTVVTAEDLPDTKFSFFPELADKSPLCPLGGTVRYIGDEVAAVAAVDEETAFRAAELIAVEYEPLPAVSEPSAALAAQAPKIHEGGNIAYELRRAVGDVDESFAAADYVFEETYQTSRQAHAILEPRGCLVYFDRTGHLTVWHPTQAPHPLRSEVARALGIRESRIRVIQPEVGGGFGARLVMNLMVPIAAVLSKKTGRPIRIVNTREEEFLCAGTRYPYEFKLRIGVMKDGTIRAKELEVIADNGAYNDKGPSTINFIALSFFTSYELHKPASRYDAKLVYTNKGPGAAFRGFGHAEERFAFESALDAIAIELGMEPAEIRLRNLHRSSERKCVEQAVQRSRWSARPREKNKRIGRGLAVLAETGAGLRYYGYNSTEAIVKIDPDGSVALIAPVADTGTGTRTVMAQIVAEELGIPVARIRLSQTDTDIIPYDLGSWASRTTYVCGNAVAAAARDAKRQLFQIAAVSLDANPSKLIASDEKIFLPSRPEVCASFDEVIDEAYNKQGRLIIGKGGFFDEKAPVAKQADDYEMLSPVIAASCHVAEVEVDLETGSVQVLRYLAVHDIGKLINPIGAEGQVEGGIAQGIGFALSEELIVDGGQVLNPNFIDYRVPTFTSVPRKCDCVFLENGDSEGPFGAKGIGEITFGPVAPAIANAIADAVGVQLTVLPMTPTRVLEALAAAQDLAARRTSS